MQLLYRRDICYSRKFYRRYD